MKIENITSLRATFDKHFGKGIEALENDEYVIAKMKIIKASEVLLKMTKELDSVIKTENLKQSEELQELLEKISGQIKTESNLSIADNLNISVNNNFKEAKVNHPDKEDAIDKEIEEKIYNIKEKLTV